MPQLLYTYFIELIVLILFLTHHGDANAIGWTSVASLEGDISVILSFEFVSQYLAMQY
jgi:hypothetical protein